MTWIGSDVILPFMREAFARGAVEGAKQRDEDARKVAIVVLTVFYIFDFG